LSRCLVGQHEYKGAAPLSLGLSGSFSISPSGVRPLALAEVRSTQSAPECSHPWPSTLWISLFWPHAAYRRCLALIIFKQSQGQRGISLSTPAIALYATDQPLAERGSGFGVQQGSTPS